MIPVTQVGIAGLLVLFWFLFTTIGAGLGRGRVLRRRR